MEYLKYAGLYTVYSSITALVFIIIDVIMYPALLQGLIEKKLPFKVIIQDLYKSFTTTEKDDKFHKFTNKFLNSIASVGYQFAMLVYMLVLIILYSLALLLIFNVAFYALGSFFAMIGLKRVGQVIDIFNILFEIYGFFLIAFLISHSVTTRYHRYINERFELKARGFSDHIHSLFRILIFLIPGVIGVLATYMKGAFSDFIYWLGKLINVSIVYRFCMGSVPKVFLRYTNGSLFFMSTLIALVLVILFDIGYTKRISSKANKKILKDTKQQVKKQEESLLATEEELAKKKQEIESIEEEKKALETTENVEESTEPASEVVEKVEEVKEEISEEISDVSVQEVTSEETKLEETNDERTEE